MTTDAQAASVDNLFGSDPVNAPVQAPEPAPSEQAYRPIEAFSPAPTEQQPAPVVTAPPAPEPVQQPQAHQVPLAQLIEERKSRQAAERERTQLLEAVARLTAQQQPQAIQQPAQPQPVIDPLEDPQGFLNAVTHAIEEKFQRQALVASENKARQEFGDDLVETAANEAFKQGLDTYFASRPNPHAEAVSWYRSQQLAQTIGSDPAAYEAQIRAKVQAEVQAEVMARLQAGKAPPANLPPSLSTSTNASGGVEHVPASRDFFNSMMSNRPNRG